MRNQLRLDRTEPLHHLGRGDVVHEEHGVHPRAEELLAHLDQAGLSRYDMPEYFIALPEIPLTASGKIYKRDLVEDVRTGKLQVTPVRYGVAA